MIGALIVTHGNLAYELLKAAQKIESSVSGVEAVPLEWTDSVDEAREKIRKALEHLGPDRGVINFTDMFGGTPSNIGMTFLEKDRLEVITGVNLPMLIKLAGLRSSSDLLAVAKEMRDHGRSAIWVASDLLRGEKTGA